MSRRTYHAKQFFDAIPTSGGIITTIAKRVGCDWHTAKKFIMAHPTVARAYQNECELIGDIAENALYKAIKDGELSAVKFYLTTKGKGRGYTERKEVGGKDGADIVLRVIYDNAGPEDDD